MIESTVIWNYLEPAKAEMNRMVKEGWRINSCFMFTSHETGKDEIMASLVRENL